MWLKFFNSQIHNNDRFYVQVSCLSNDLVYIVDNGTDKLILKATWQSHRFPGNTLCLLEGRPKQWSRSNF